jgi:hypothetical protein
MRFTKSLAIAASTLALATGAAFAGEEPLTHQSDPMGYQPYAYESYEQGGPELLSEAQPQEYEVYEVYVVPAEIVLIPLEPSEPSISGNELG